MIKSQEKVGGAARSVARTTGKKRNQVIPPFFFLLAVNPNREKAQFPDQKAKVLSIHFNIEAVSS